MGKVTILPMAILTVDCIKYGLTGVEKARIIDSTTFAQKMNRYGFTNEKTLFRIVIFKAGLGEVDDIVV
jgi:hypothetical protein